MAEESANQPNGASETPTKVSNFNNLKPWEIDPRKIENVDDRKKAVIVLEEWLDTVQKQVSEVLSKHGVTTFQMSILHPCMKTPFVMGNGNNYTCAKIARAAALVLRDRVMQELQLDKQEGHSNE
jgi:TPP-dependent indolepyruvate ferredoxin oxidoreductase alpha subunit